MYPEPRFDCELGTSDQPQNLKKMHAAFPTQALGQVLTDQEQLEKECQAELLMEQVMHPKLENHKCQKVGHQLPFRVFYRFCSLEISILVVIAHRIEPFPKFHISCTFEVVTSLDFNS